MGVGVGGSGCGLGLYNVYKWDYCTTPASKPNAVSCYGVLVIPPCQTCAIPARTRTPRADEDRSN